MNDPKAREIAYNAASRHLWDAFEGHRRRVSALLRAGGGPAPTRLCVLGAGNANDLDLPALLRAHRTVHLVDLDREALAQGAARQGVAGHCALALFAGVDLTAMLGPIASWSPTTPIAPGDLAALVEAPACLVRPALAGPYDLVASTCVLSQLIGNAFHALGEGHPQFLAVVQAIRAGHLRLLTDLVTPGGLAVLITDVVSSDTLPALAAMPDSALPALLPQLVRDRNFFHGVNPLALASVFRTDPFLSARTVDLEAIAPWGWNLHARRYLVLALRYRVAPPRG